MCGECRKGCEPSDVGCYCGYCGSGMSVCSVCELLVRGLYVWCQGCGHGGHAEHMADWFSTSRVCPTGCMHRCVDELVIVFSVALYVQYDTMMDCVVLYATLSFDISHRTNTATVQQENNTKDKKETQNSL